VCIVVVGDMCVSLLSEIDKQIALHQPTTIDMCTVHTEPHILIPKQTCISSTCTAIVLMEAAPDSFFLSKKDLCIVHRKCYVFFHTSPTYAARETAAVVNEVVYRGLSFLKKKYCVFSTKTPVFSPVMSHIPTCHVTHNNTSRPTHQ